MNEYEWQIKTVGRMMEVIPSKDQDKGKYWLGVIYSVDGRGWLRKMGEVRHLERNLKCYVVVSRKLRESTFSFQWSKSSFWAGRCSYFWKLHEDRFFFHLWCCFWGGEHWCRHLENDMHSCWSCCWAQCSHPHWSLTCLISQYFLIEWLTLDSQKCLVLMEQFHKIVILSKIFRLLNIKSNHLSWNTLRNDVECGINATWKYFMNCDFWL